MLDIIKKIISKILFFFFIFSFIHIFIVQDKVNAYSVPDNGCILTDVSATDTVLTISDLNGTLPLCFRADSSLSLTLKAGGDGSSFNSDSATITNTGIPGSYTFTGTTTYRVNYVKNFYENNIIPTLPITATITNFFLKDNNTPIAGEATAIYKLTLLPAFRVKFLNKSPTSTDEFDNTRNTPRGLVVYKDRSVNTAFGTTSYSYIPPNVDITGGTWTFAGWKNESGGSTAFNFDNTTWPDGTNWDGAVNNFVNVFAKWTLNCTTTGYEKKGDGTACQLKTYTITFDKNDGTTGTTAVHATTTVNHGTTSVKTPNTNPTRDVLNGSWTFSGWATTSTGDIGYGPATNTSITIPAVTENKTLYAKWTFNCNSGYELSGTSCQLKTYTITFDKNDGTTGTTAVHATTTVNHGTTSVKTPNTNPTRTAESNGSWTFNGWATTSTGNVIGNISATNTPIIIPAVTNDTILYAKWTFKCDSKYSLLNGSCEKNPCGVDTLDSATTNGEACNITLYATVTNITNGDVVSTVILNSPGAQSNGVGSPINLKYDEQISVRCVNARNMDRQNHSSTTSSWAYIGTFNQDSGVWPNATNSYIGTSTTKYNNSIGSDKRLAYNCYNIGYDTNNKLLFFTTPKKFFVKYLNPSGDTNQTFPTTSISGGTAQGATLWDGQAVAQPTNPTRNGYTFDGWCKNSTGWNNCNSNGTGSNNFNFSNINWSDLTNGGVIQIYAKWTQNCTASVVTNTRTIDGNDCPSPKIGKLKQTQISTTTTSVNCSVSTTNWVNLGAASDSSCACPTGAELNNAGKCVCENGIELKDGDTTCPSAPTLTCRFKNTTATDGSAYQDYILGTTSNPDTGRYCKDSTGATTTTIFVNTQNRNQATDTSKLLATNENASTSYDLLFTAGFPSSKYLDPTTLQYTGKLSVACPTLLTNSEFPLPLLTEINNCGNVPKPTFRFFDVSANNVASGSKINIVWQIANPSTNCKIIAKGIKSNTLLLDTSTNTNSILYKNTTNSTSNTGKVVIGNATKGFTIASSYSSSTNGSLFTITESTQFTGICEGTGVFSTSSIVRNVNVVSGGER